MNGARILLALSLALACGVATSAQGARGKHVGDAAFGDACTTVPGYGAFRAQLERVVAARDGVGLRALFHPQGAMRVNGVGGRANTPDWGFEPPQAQAVWTSLDEILTLGCARSGEGLVLPAMAASGEVQEDQLVVLREDAIRLAPNPGARVIRRVKRGDVFTFSVYDTPSGWTSVLVGGRLGYLRTSSLRSPFSVRMELEPVGDSWRIREFGSGV